MESSKFLNSPDNPKFDFCDITLVPETLSFVTSRKQVDISGCLMVSPMDSVVDDENWYDFYEQDMAVCVPRGCEFEYDNLVFTSISLEEFESHILALELGQVVKDHRLLLVDIANGHMEKLYRLTKKFLELDSKTTLMVGNIANPRTYQMFAELGVHFVRCGIGGGSACTTSANTGVHYPMASLIHECYEIKKKYQYETRIVADGGFQNFDDIIKALALGADFVMLGSILNKCLESCADTYLWGIKVNWLKDLLWKSKFFKQRLYKSYRGMSTKEVQKTWNRHNLKTAEGICKTNRVEYTLAQWMDNFHSYLRSAMSYCGCTNLEEFKESRFVFITDNALRRFKK